MEIAWLIEIPMTTFGGPPVWWTGDYSTMTSLWSEDSLKAVRFARKQDAEAVIAGAVPSIFKKDSMATEHVWQ